MEDVNKEELVAVASAARALGSTELHVLMHIKRGLLAGREVGGIWHVTRASLTTLEASGAAAKEAVLCRPACSRAGGCASCT